MKGKNDDKFSPLICTVQKMQNTIPNLILLVSDYCWDEYKKDVK